jgi:hypothetical protein
VSRTIGSGPWCGTAGGYNNHACRCGACRRAWAEAVKRRWRERITAAGGRHPEGKPESTTTYVNYGCRCGGCRAAHTEYDRARRAATKIADGASPHPPSATPNGDAA